MLLRFVNTVSRALASNLLWHLDRLAHIEGITKHVCGTICNKCLHGRRAIDAGVGSVSVMAVMVVKMVVMTRIVRSRRGWRLLAVRRSYSRWGGHLRMLLQYFQAPAPRCLDQLLLILRMHFVYDVIIITVIHSQFTLSICTARLLLSVSS